VPGRRGGVTAGRAGRALGAPLGLRRGRARGLGRRRALRSLGPLRVGGLGARIEARGLAARAEGAAIADPLEG